MSGKPLTAGAAAALTLAALAAGPLATPLAAQQRGTVEIGGYGQWTTFDDRLNLDDAIGLGLRLGAFLSPRWALEFDAGQSKAEPASQTFQPGGAPVPCPGTTNCPTEWTYNPIYLRLAYNVPVGERTHVVLGAHAARLDYEFDHGIGGGGLLGLRFGLTPAVALRLDALADWNRFDDEDAEGDDSGINYTARAGLSIMLRNSDPTPPVPPPVVAAVDSTPTPAPPPVNQDSIDRARARADSIANAERMTAAARATMAEAVLFDFDQSAIRPDAAAALDRKLPVLQANPTMRIRVSGHADVRGSDEYNVALGQRRANAARQYLIQRGVAAERIEVVSYGEERPVCESDDESCHQRNRRDEFEITAGGPSFVVPGGD